MIGFRETVAKLWTIQIGEEDFFRSASRSYGDVHFGGHTAQDTEIGINVGFDGRITEIDLCEMAILFFGQIECELIVDSEIVIARALAWVTMIMVCSVTLFTVITRQTFCATIAFGCFAVAMCGLAYLQMNGIRDKQINKWDAF